MQKHHPHPAPIRRNKRLATLLILTGIALALFADASFAQSLGDIADNVSKSGSKIGSAIQVLGKVIGIGLVFLGVYTHYKAHKEAQGGGGRSSHTLAIVSWFVGAAMIYTTSVVNTAADTVWGTSGNNSMITIPTK